MPTLRFLRTLRRSLTAQISLSIAVISILLTAGSGLLISRLATRELREGTELIMLSNLALLRDDLARADFDLTDTPRRLVQRMDLQLGGLHMAILDAQRRVIAASERFEVPLSALPREAISVDELPTGIEHADVRALARSLGPLTTAWSGPGQRSYRLLLARIPVTLLIGALAAASIGVWIARRILAGPKRLAAAANRISAAPLRERLSLEYTPTELVDSTLAFNRMLDRVEGSYRRLAEFSSDLAHDLRTPINNLLGEAQVALAKPRSAAEYRAVIESSVEDYERISRLIENMLFLARADDPHTAIHREWIALHPLLVRGRGYYALLAEERGVGMMLDMQGADPARHQVWADATLLNRAIGNLVSNALRYAPRGTSIRVATQLHDGGGVTLEVINDGPPIAPEHQARIFERAFRVDESRAGSAAGSGLGLAIVKSIMELHAGSVSVISGPGRSTVFRLWFPGPA